VLFYRKIFLSLFPVNPLLLTKLFSQTFNLICVFNYEKNLLQQTFSHGAAKYFDDRLR
jgi:hypothetical protein